MAAHTCGAEEARQTLPALLERAQRGETTLITRRGRSCAAIIPVELLPPPRPGASLLALRGSGRGLWGEDPSATVAAERDGWT